MISRIAEYWGTSGNAEQPSSWNVSNLQGDWNPDLGSTRKSNPLNLESPETWPQLHQSEEKMDRQGKNTLNITKGKTHQQKTSGSTTSSLKHTNTEAIHTKQKKIA